VFEFQRGSRPKNYLARREQWRLLLLVMVLGLVVVLGLEARNPARYRWLWGIGAAAPGGAATGESGDAGAVDTRIDFEPLEEEIPGTFFSPGPVQLVEVDSGRYFPGVKPVYLDSICDDEPFRYGERDAWFHLLEILQKTPEATLRESSTGRATFVQLYQQSKEYRGELVTLRGTLVRAHHLPAPRNDYGIDGYYQVWLQPEDNRSFPMVIYCLDLPEGFPTGMTLSEEAEITGFFFKRWAYKASDTIRSTPVTLARTVHWYRRPEVAGGPPGGVLVVVLMIAGAAAVALVVVGYVYLRTRRGGPTELASRTARGATGDARAEADAGRHLRILAENEEAPEP